MALFCSSHVIVMFRSVTLALLGVGTADGWNAVNDRVKVWVTLGYDVTCGATCAVAEYSDGASS